MIYSPEDREIDIEKLAEDAFNEGWRSREARPSPMLDSRGSMRREWLGSNARDAILEALSTPMTGGGEGPPGVTQIAGGFRLPDWNDLTNAQRAVICDEGERWSDETTTWSQGRDAAHAVYTKIQAEVLAPAPPLFEPLFEPPMSETPEAPRTWFTAQAPRCVPVRKGPFPPSMAKAFARELMAARPGEILTVIEVSDGVPEVSDLGEWLSIRDGRLRPSIRRHRETVAAAFASRGKAPHE